MKLHLESVHDGKFYVEVRKGSYEAALYRRIINDGRWNVRLVRQLEEAIGLDSWDRLVVVGDPTPSIRGRYGRIGLYGRFGYRQCFWK